MAFQNVRFGAHEALEFLFVAAFRVVGHSDKGQQILVHCAWIDGRQITSDDSFTFEALNPRVNCRRSETESLADCGVRDPSVILN